MNHQFDIQRVRSSKVLLLIDPVHILSNLAEIRKCAKSSKVMAVLKGDAYGAGAKEIVSIIDEMIDGYAVDNLHEGITLRSLGVTKKILVFEGGIRDCMDLLYKYDLTPGICDVDQLQIINQLGKEHGQNIAIWLLTNIGFNRSGVRTDANFEDFVSKAKNASNVTVEAVYAHLTNSHAVDGVSNRQIEEFKDRVKLTEYILGKRVETSLFASHSILRWGNEFLTDWIRPGIIIYGYSIFDQEILDKQTMSRLEALKPALTLKARVMSTIRLEANQYLGYNQTISAKEGGRLANIGIGFGSGFPSRIQNLPVLVNGTRTNTIGNAGMDIIQVDISNIPNVHPLDWVTFFGSDMDSTLDLSEFLRPTGLSPYEFLTNLKSSKQFYTNEK